MQLSQVWMFIAYPFYRLLLQPTYRFANCSFRELWTLSSPASYSHFTPVLQTSTTNLCKFFPLLPACWNQGQCQLFWVFIFTAPIENTKLFSTYLLLPTSHSKTQWFKTAVYCYHQWFFGWTGLSRVVFAEGSGGCSQMAAGGGATWWPNWFCIHDSFSQTSDPSHHSKHSLLEELVLLTPWLLASKRNYS